MLTQCPHCLTLFRVGPEHLKAAAGQVRCCRCHQVFNALQSLQESPTSFFTHDTDTKTHEAAAQLPETSSDSATAPGLERPPELTETSDWQDFMEQPPSSDRFEPMLPDPAASESQDQLIDDIVEQDDGLAPEPDYFTGGRESEMSELLDQDSSSLLLPDSGEPTAEPPLGPANIVAFTPTTEYAAVEEPTQEPQQPEEQRFEDSILKDEAIDQELGRLDYDSVPAFHVDTVTIPETITDDDRALNFEVEHAPKPRDKFTLYWLIGSLLLLLPLAGQLAWQLRDDLIHSEAGQQTLNLICRVAGCEVPTRRALDQIIIDGRNLTSHPKKPDVLSLQLSIVNTAAFEQPFPLLGLSLYNDKGNLIARRTFTASEYLPQGYKEERMMPLAQSILVEMELVDPGKEVTGFSFDFY
jgi:predicted Zn finger-like uncharacterized protein